MLQPRREARQARQGEHAGSPADVQMDPEGSQGTAGRQSKLPWSWSPVSKENL